MILTSPQPRRHRPGARTLAFAKCVALPLALTVLLGACTNSKLVISPLYNRLDDQMRKEFNKLGDFDDAQKAMFEVAVGTGHVWHRQSELPRYAELLKTIASSLSVPGRTTPDVIAAWAEAVEARAVAARECHPVNFLFDLTRSLSDDEIDFIERRFARERVKNREKYESRTREERITNRLDNIDKWARRIGIEFDAQQRAIVRSGLEDQVSLRREYFQLSDRWKKTLFQYAREQDAPDYDERMQAHFAELWTLLENAHPDEWQSNRDLWRRVSARLEQSLTAEQRLKASAWLSKMANTLVAISKDEPSFKVVADPRLGCLVPVQPSDEA